MSSKPTSRRGRGSTSSASTPRKRTGSRQASSKRATPAGKRSRSAASRRSRTSGVNPRTRELLQQRARQIAALDIDYIDSEEFTDRAIVRQIQSEASDWLAEPLPNPHGDVAISSHALLSFADEQLLFRAMNFYRRRACLDRETLHPSRPGVKKMDRIEMDVAKANKLRDRIVLSNLRLVISIARRLCSPSIPFEDLVSDGNLILMRAVEKFDYSRGYRFSTYATHAVQRDIFRRFQRTTRHSQRFLPGSQEYLHDMSDETRAPEEDQHQHSVFGQVLGLIEESLDDRERFILKARFGLENESKPLKLRTIAESLGLSKERVRQLQNRAIGKLQENVRWDSIQFDAAAPIADLIGC